MIGRMVLFGASGDLASQLLMPAVAQLADARFTAYAHLILEMLNSNPMLFIRGDEAEEAWRIIDPVMKAWTAGDVLMQEYPARQTPPGPLVLTSRTAPADQLDQPADDVNALLRNGGSGSPDCSAVGWP
jgi:glucose-6-phosphate 1-dehydrogenase